MGWLKSAWAWLCDLTWRVWVPVAAVLATVAAILVYRAVKEKKRRAHERAWGKALETQRQAQRMREDAGLVEQAKIEVLEAAYEEDMREVQRTEKELRELTDQGSQGLAEAWNRRIRRRRDR